ncbi:peptidyl-prolyl isomerase D [Dendrobium catenatum]|uniref:Peptidyl-prolyl isomerase D n=1 Tax=Dendrobium catenatum TaxID=906689 RepID=A0A2I0WHQ9_9ASPA|nr:peptidyl-prolyl isomerase D [Dendrobium catenatum]
MLKLISSATELLLKEDWNEYINLYSRCHFPQTSPNDDDDNSTNLRRTLCSALSNRAEAYSKLRDLSAALIDCDHALKLNPFHLKSLVCKGNVLLDLHCYSQAFECFHRAKALVSTDSAISQLLK